MRPGTDTIAAPPFPARLPWVNVAALRMDKQIGRPVLIEFWDFCRVNSLRTLPYVRAWHERYAEAGLRVIGVHTPGFPCSRDEAEVRAACARLDVEHPVVIDADAQIWGLYENAGWPARYLWDQRGMLHDYHYGEGAYDETERAIQELLGVSGDLVAPVRPEDVPGAVLAVPTPDVAGPYSGPYEAGAVWAVLDGDGTASANGDEIRVDGPGVRRLVEHPRHTAAVLDFATGPGVTCHATCFVAGLA